MYFARITSACIIVACIGLIMSGNVAEAQIAGKATGETVRTRPDPDLDPLGIHARSFLIHPRISVFGMFNDNVFATEVAKVDDTALLLRPVIEAQSQWSRHELVLYADANFAWYNDRPSEDYQTYTFQAQGRIDVTRKSNLLLFGSYLTSTEARDDPDAGLAAELTKYSQVDANAQFNQEFGRFTWSVGGYLRRVDFDDGERTGGGIIDNQDRDRDIYRVNTRLDFEAQPDVGVFVEYTHNWREYDALVDDGGFARDSEGYNIVTGIDLRFTAVLFGSFHVGYLNQKYVDPAFDDIDGFSYGANLDWNVTEITTIHLGAERLLQETTQDNSSGYFADRIRLRLDHELRRDLMISASGMIGRNDFKQIDRVDDVWSVGAEVEWTINRNLVLMLAYSHSVRKADFRRFLSYSGNVVMFGLEARY